MLPDKAHAKLSASGSERWLNCPASVQLSENAPPQKSSSYADEGTDAHACHEFLLKNWGSKASITTAMKKWPKDMVGHAQRSVSHIIGIAGQIGKDAEILCETKVDLSFVRKGMFGTTDAAIIDLFGVLWVFDYKYGAGVAVDPDCTQLIYYALGIAHQHGFNFLGVRLVVIQPRAEHKDGPIRSHYMSIDDLIEWEDKFRKGAEATDDPLAEMNAGEWCRWCPAKTICPAISDQAFKQARIDFAPTESSEIALPVPNMLKPEVISNVLLGIDKLEVWISAVREHALFVLERGARIPGFKLVKKRSTRKWADEKDVEKTLVKIMGMEAYTTKLRSPAQLENVIGEWPGNTKQLSSVLKYATTNESSGVTIVPESDKRPVFNAIEADFKVLDNVKKTKTNTQRKRVKTNGTRK